MFHYSRAVMRQVPIALLLLLAFGASAGEEDEIVTGCHFSNAEWGGGYDQSLHQGKSIDARRGIAVSREIQTLPRPLSTR